MLRPRPTHPWCHGEPAQREPGARVTRHDAGFSVEDLGELRPQLAELGPFFGLSVLPSGPGWQDLASLLTDPAVLSRKVQQAEAAIGTAIERESVRRRVAASTVQLALVARLVSPMMAGAVLGGVVIELDLRQSFWRDVPGEVTSVAVPRLVGVRAGSLSDLTASIDEQLDRQGDRPAHRHDASCCADLGQSSVEQRVFCHRRGDGSPGVATPRPVGPSVRGGRGSAGAASSARHRRL